MWRYLHTLLRVYQNEICMDAFVYLCLPGPTRPCLVRRVFFMAVYRICLNWSGSSTAFPHVSECVMLQEIFVSVRDTAADATYSASKIDLGRKLKYPFDILDTYYICKHIYIYIYICKYWIYWVFIGYVGYTVHTGNTPLVKWIE